MKTLGIHYCKIVLMESFACVHHASLTAKILYPFIDMFCVQWPALISLYPKAKYTGRLLLGTANQAKNFEFQNSPNKYIHINYILHAYVLVTVGSTHFDNLIKEIDNIEFVKILQAAGYTGLHVQTGNGSYKLQHITDITLHFDVQVFDYKPSLSQEMQGAGLIIGHAGAGTILEVLGLGKPLIVVPNDTLMWGHQADIAEELAKESFLFVSKCGELKQAIRKLDFTKLKKFPAKESELFNNHLKQLLGLSKKAGECPRT